MMNLFEGKLPGLDDVMPAPLEFIPEADVTVNVAAAARYGLPPGAVRRDAAVLMASEPVSTISTPNEDTVAAVWSTPATRNSLQDLERLPIDTATGGHVPLGQVATITLAPTPSQIIRDTSVRMDEVDANVAPGHGLSSVANEVKALMAAEKLPSGYTLSLQGEIIEREAAQQHLIWYGIAALVVILLASTGGCRQSCHSGPGRKHGRQCDRSSASASGYAQDVDWSLLGCARKGHVTYAPDEPELRDRLMVPTAAGTAWRCLRCGAFVTGGRPGRGPAAAAPLIRRGKELRSELILRVFAVERFLRFLLFGAAAYGVWRFRYDRAGIQRAYNSDLPAIRALYRDMGFDVNHSKLLGLIQHAFTLTPRTLTYLAIGLAAYAIIELVESVGLWLGRRWGEYFAMVATSVFLPYEIYDLTVKVTWLRITAFVINLLLVIYLVWTRRLFGVRGGKAAYEARLHSESVIEVEQAALAAASSRQPGQPGDGAAPPARTAQSRSAHPDTPGQRPT